MLSGKRLRDAVGRVLPTVPGENIGTISVDVTLDNLFWVPHSPALVPYIDLSNIPDEVDLYQQVRITRGAFTLSPGRYAKARLAEEIQMPGDLAGLFTLRSQIAQAGLDQVTSLLIRPNWTGHLVLELFNAVDKPLLLRPGLKIGQISFFELEEL